MVLYKDSGAEWVLLRRSREETFPPDGTLMAAFYYEEDAVSSHEGINNPDYNGGPREPSFWGITPHVEGNFDTERYILVSRAYARSIGLIQDSNEWGEVSP